MQLFPGFARWFRFIFFRRSRVHFKQSPNSKFKAAHLILNKNEPAEIMLKTAVIREILYQQSPLFQSGSMIALQE
jgi:hypothetical protein